jgi:hypothetical protein
LGYKNILFSQNIQLDKTKLVPVNVSMSHWEIDYKKVVRVIKDSSLKEVDAASFVRLNDVDFINGTIEIKVLKEN